MIIQQDKVCGIQKRRQRFLTLIDPRVKEDCGIFLNMLEGVELPWLTDQSTIFRRAGMRTGDG
ncbi:MULTISPECIES: hypothetical protein [unclassified Paraburkholderia]|uniref:hypothetical protein n=1 Tax=unclassified Paraburkholderia TaxID=2615204 RepID=UPI0016102A2F|nr:MULTISPECIES: hypothetical protein [unclassified Paraburkholderia]MBB5448431.1 hypothetical protein [Paraburkholderia sp. WSM4177]MBB5488811.1 hypothetical protein [Paraburkholderia sp. WSM4180]